MEFWLAWFGENHRSTDVKSLAQAAEELGYFGVALSDHVALPKLQQSLHPIQKIAYDPLLSYAEPITTAATMAAVTGKLRFMTYAYVMGMREPFSVAKQAGALADLSENRFALGITPGWQREEMAILGHDPATRGSRFLEALEVIDGLWRNDLFSYRGKHYAFEDVGVSPRPTIPPDILIGGNSKLSIERAAQYKGWIGMNHPLEELRSMLTQLDELSNGQARKYVIAGQELSDAYMAGLQALGIKGLVVMPWSPMNPNPEPVRARIDAMTALARRWIG